MLWKKFIINRKLITISFFSFFLISCASEKNYSSSPKIDGGSVCFAQGADNSNTAEGSGISIFYDRSIFPGNTNNSSPWTFLSARELFFTSAPKYDHLKCSQRYEKIIDAVLMQDRNRMGTHNDGQHLSYKDLRATLSNSLSPFVGLDTFYHAANDLGLGVLTGLNPEDFEKNLKKICNGGVSGKNLYATDRCPNGTYMHNFLWRENGLLVNNGKSSMVGVIPNKPQPNKKYASGLNPGLSWTRGYLLLKYSNHINTIPFYTAIFDAGSSGTRISLFKVKPSLPGDKADVQLIYSKSFNDEGINDFLNGKGEIDSNVLPNKVLPKNCSGLSALGAKDVGPCVIQPLLDSLTMNLPKDVTSNKVKIELFSTAGMRTEERTNGGSHSIDQIKSFYESALKLYIRNTVFINGATYPNLGDFKTINGNSEEGLWTWVNLNDVYFDVFNERGHCGKLSMGSFEVGGSSMQIVFPVNQKANEKVNIYNINVNGCSINVFSKTFLGLGSDDTRKFMRAFNY